jgi:heme-degrading monooxygenase HmoA
MQIPVSEHEPIVAFTLARYSRRASFLTLAHLGLDRWPLLRTAGLRFWRLLGVGKGRVFNPHADLQRSALFTVWDSYAALKQFEQHSSIMRRMGQRAEEAWTVHMLPVSWHGLWSGRDPFAGIAAAQPPNPGPWVILTRASIRLARLRAFLQAVPPVAELLLQQPDLLNSVGVGESPLLKQATLSVWRSLPALKHFAYDSSSPHSAVIRRTRREGWYSEELFARFRPVASWGTWDGIDPVKQSGI